MLLVINQKALRADAKDLIFISRIKRDGSGVVPVTREEYKRMLTFTWMKNEYFLNGLSMTEKTYIACGFNSYVVKIRKRAFKRMQREDQKLREAIKFLRV